MNPCCAACLHAITDPERPVHFDGCFFHARHLPPEAVATGGFLGSLGSWPQALP
jgi:hypothetical protein